MKKTTWPLHVVAKSVGSRLGGGFRRGFLARFGRGPLSFQISFAAAAFLNFVVLFSHINLLYIAVLFILDRAKTMKISSFASNLFLLLALVLAGGCKSAEEKEKEKRAATLRFHLETNPDGTPHNAPVPIFRTNPIYVNVQQQFLLDEGLMRQADIVDVDEHGGWGIRILFDDRGARRLEYITTANKGKRFAIFGKWDERRWLAAPLITKNITNGVFVFTPDATREEAELIVEGLNNVIKKLNKPYIF